jgi:hypothetical protein
MNITKMGRSNKPDMGKNTGLEKRIF